MITPRTLPPNIFQTQSHSEVMAFVQLSRSFNLPSTLIIRCHVSTRATKEASCFWGCGQFLTLIIKRILDIKRIFPCNFGNKRMRLLTRVYGIHMPIAPTGFKYCMANTNCVTNLDTMLQKIVRRPVVEFYNFLTYFTLTVREPHTPFLAT